MPPLNGRLASWLGVVASGVAILALGAALNTWKQVGAMEDDVRNAKDDHGKVLVIETEIKHIKGDIQEINESTKEILRKLEERDRDSGD